eukprot:403366263
MSQSLMLDLGNQIFSQDGLQFRFGLWFWTYWPKASHDSGLFFLRNIIVHPFHNVAWHTTRHFPTQPSLRFKMLRALTKSNYDLIQECLDEGWDINSPIDFEGKFNAASLAAHLDNLELLHFLDLNGADISNGTGKFNYTPLMTSSMSWNVRIIDYLLERGVNPEIKDKFGFTALQKAKIKQYRTIQSMLSQYEQRYQFTRKDSYLPQITTDDWRKKLQENGANHINYKTFDIWKGKDNHERALYKPSQHIVEGEYPFSNLEDNQLTLKFFDDYAYFESHENGFIC